jgi:geranylgeranyl pyrophosphate synthase
MTYFVDQIVEQALLAHVDNFKARQGKRIRGTMVQLSYELSGSRGTIPAVIVDAIECLHAGSLIIDDVQDDSLMRRGEPTLHQVIGVPLAVNAGNWMYFRAVEMLSKASLPCDQRSKLIESMVTTGRRCHEGQAVDLHARVDKIPASRWLETVEAISLLKTGALVELAVAMGCIASNASWALMSSVTSFGRNIGVALQMRNDLEELSNMAGLEVDRRAGPARDDDLRNARVTWPWAWAFELAGEAKCSSLLQTLHRSPHDHVSVAEELLEIVLAHGDRVIAGLIIKQMRLLAEDTTNRDVLDRLRECLRPIERSCAAISKETGTPKEQFPCLRTSEGALC